ncbi:m-phase inducer phosphatase [Tilletia horrida]|nr:m-phase inducer phosphatase [Tilletia horrida]
MAGIHARPPPPLLQQSAMLPSTSTSSFDSDLPADFDKSFESSMSLTDSLDDIQQPLFQRSSSTASAHAAAVLGDAKSYRSNSLDQSKQQPVRRNGAAQQPNARPLSGASVMASPNRPLSLGAALGTQLNRDSPNLAAKGMTSRFSPPATIRRENSSMSMSSSSSSPAQQASSPAHRKSSLSQNTNNGTYAPARPQGQLRVSQDNGNPDPTSAMWAMQRSDADSDSDDNDDSPLPSALPTPDNFSNLPESGTFLSPLGRLFGTELSLNDSSNDKNNKIVGADNGSATPRIVGSRAAGGVPAPAQHSKGSLSFFSLNATASLNTGLGINMGPNAFPNSNNNRSSSQESRNAPSALAPAPVLLAGTGAKIRDRAARDESFSSPGYGDSPTREPPMKKRPSIIGLRNGSAPLPGSSAAANFQSSSRGAAGLFAPRPPLQKSATLSAASAAAELHAAARPPAVHFVSLPSRAGKLSAGPSLGNTTSSSGSQPQIRYIRPLAKRSLSVAVGNGASAYAPVQSVFGPLQPIPAAINSAGPFTSTFPENVKAANELPTASGGRIPKSSSGPIPTTLDSPNTSMAAGNSPSPEGQRVMCDGDLSDFFNNPQSPEVSFQMGNAASEGSSDRSKNSQSSAAPLAARDDFSDISGASILAGPARVDQSQGGRLRMNQERRMPSLTAAIADRSLTESDRSSSPMSSPLQSRQAGSMMSAITKAPKLLFTAPARKVDVPDTVGPDTSDSFGPGPSPCPVPARPGLFRQGSEDDSSPFVLGRRHSRGRSSSVVDTHDDICVDPSPLRRTTIPEDHEGDISMHVASSSDRSVGPSTAGLRNVLSKGPSQLRPPTGPASNSNQHQTASHNPSSPGPSANCSDIASPSAIGDAVERYILPSEVGVTDRLMRLKPETMIQLLNGGFDDVVSGYTIIDCRYSYEYLGGHIPGAVNLRTLDEIKDYLLTPRSGLNTGSDTLPPRTTTGRNAAHKHVLIFHCEFSLKRAPKMAAALRDLDRSLAQDWPRCHYPELYILQGGYAGFYKFYPAACQPRAYVCELDPGFEGQWKAEQRVFKREFMRHKSMPVPRRLQRTKSDSAASMMLAAKPMLGEKRDAEGVGETPSRPPLARAGASSMAILTTDHSNGSIQSMGSSGMMGPPAGRSAASISSASCGLRTQQAVRFGTRQPGMGARAATASYVPMLGFGGSAMIREASGEDTDSFSR